MRLIIICWTERGWDFNMEEMSKAKLATSKLKCLLGETRNGQESNIKIMLKVWSEFLATDPEARVLFLALPEKK
jgi:hypothetical protein